MTREMTHLVSNMDSNMGSLSVQLAVFHAAFALVCIAALAGFLHTSAAVPLAPRVLVAAGLCGVTGWHMTRGAVRWSTGRAVTADELWTSELADCDLAAACIFCPTWAAVTLYLARHSKCMPLGLGRRTLVNLTYGLNGSALMCAVWMLSLIHI